jgi:hypothetical protein
LSAPQSFFMNESMSPSMVRSVRLASGFAASTLAPSLAEARLMLRRLMGWSDGAA